MDDATTPAPPTSGLVEQLTRRLVAQLRLRLELLGVEVAEERLRLGSLLGWGAAVLFFAFLSIVLATALAVVAYWDTPYRLHVIAAALILALVATAIGMWMLVRRQRTESTLFRYSLRELGKDGRILERTT